MGAGNFKATGTNVITLLAGAVTGTYCVKGSNTGSSAVGGAQPGQFFWYDSARGGLSPWRTKDALPGGACY